MGCRLPANPRLAGSPRRGRCGRYAPRSGAPASSAGSRPARRSARRRVSHAAPAGAPECAASGRGRRRVACRRRALPGLGVFSRLRDGRSRPGEVRRSRVAPAGHCVWLCDDDRQRRRPHCIRAAIVCARPWSWVAFALWHRAVPSQLRSARRRSPRPSASGPHGSSSPLEEVLRADDDRRTSGSPTAADLVWRCGVPCCRGLPGRSSRLDHAQYQARR